ncbi:hypothetical protein Patl1_17566 [Pistacia atlantica]|uniref:Uncharacterized protein n=1 Tax=Pistacia atlantica TaxID=434234 RepID=A0ACC1BXP6_9ROSI|nr:hypothetical protein Patl1_17566 [Pistacia atlantica]
MSNAFSQQVCESGLLKLIDSKSLESDLDPEKVEQMAGSKREIEAKVQKILQLVKSKEQEREDGNISDSETDSELVGLIEEFHNQYQSLHARYSNLRGESGRRSRGRGRKERQASASPISGSDSDYYSSEDIDINNHTLTNGQQKMSNASRKKERGTENSEVNDRKQNSVSTTDENEASDSDENLEAFSETQTSDKDVGGQISGLKLELEALRSQKTDLESQCVKKTTEAKQLEKENKGLQGQISKLELISKEGKNEISDLQKKLKDNEKNLTSKIEGLKAQVSYLQSELDSSRASENKATGLVKGLTDQINVMQRDLDLLLEGKNKEISEYQIQVNNLKEEQTKKTAVGQRMLKEKESFLVRVKDLELELESLSDQKHKLEEQLDSKIHHMKLLREEKKRLQGRIAELSDQLSALQRNYEGREKEASTQILALDAQVHNMQQELYNMQSQKIQQDQHIIKLTTKFADQQRILKEQVETINKLSEESRQDKRRISGSKINLQTAERKMSELAEEFRKTLEDHIRVLYRRILVAEQLHNENKDSYRKTKERLEEEHRTIEKKIATHEIELRKLRDFFQPGSKSLSGLDLAVGTVEGNGDLVSRISEISTELVFAKNWVNDTLNEKRRLQREVKCLAEQLDDKEEQESLLQDKVLKLEEKLGKQGVEKLNLLKSVSQLERQLEELQNNIEAKEERLLNLGEEKREAIRQLCTFIDYYRRDYYHLKDEICKKILQIKN